jgi:NAD(P)-dependent dehydrogenase (short-subunit alcohol dehydrogenase family)
VSARPRVVLITGCASGIGMHTAVAFAARGDRVYGTVRDLGRVASLDALAAERGVEVQVVRLDVGNDDSVAAGVAEVHATAGEVDVLVNNAGIAHRGTVEMLDDRYVRENMETNYFGPLRTIRQVLPGMRQRRSGVIVNVSSIGARTPGMPTAFSYCASKRAQNALSEALSWEVRSFGIRVVSIEPGYFATNIPDNSWIADAGPYSALLDGVVRSNRSLVDGGTDPGVCAAAIVRAADDPATPLHVPVGADAEQIEAALKTGTHDDFVRMIYPLLDIDIDAVGGRV